MVSPCNEPLIGDALCLVSHGKGKCWLAGRWGTATKGNFRLDRLREDAVGQVLGTPKSRGGRRSFVKVVFVPISPNAFLDSLRVADSGNTPFNERNGVFRYLSGGVAFNVKAWATLSKKIALKDVA